VKRFACNVDQCGTPHFDEEPDGEWVRHADLGAAQASWLAEQLLGWARSEYPREVTPDCTHASLVGWLLAAALLTPEQSRELKDALDGVTRCTICSASLAHRGKERACPQCDPEVVQGWADELEEDIDF